MVRGLLIEIKNWLTGERAYSINVRDTKLPALGGSPWQCLDHEPKGDWEVRVVLDDRDLSKYSGRILLDDGSEVYYVKDIPSDAEIIDVEGVIVLNDETEINMVLDNLPDKIFGHNEYMLAWANRNGVTLRSVEEEIKVNALQVARKGHIKAKDRRKKCIDHIVFGDVRYAFGKKLYDLGCPHTVKQHIPKL